MIIFTADAVVTQHAHVLLIERKDNPGRGLKALPGGFVGKKERVKAAFIRELNAETLMLRGGHVVARGVGKDLLWAPNAEADSGH